MRVFLKKYTPEILGALFCVTLGLLSGYLSNSGPWEWYKSLNKPSFNPPPSVFGPVWTILYLMMGIALGLVWQERHRMMHLLLLFGFQFFLNLIWSFLFFTYHRIDLALIDIILLWGTLILFMKWSWTEKNLVLLFLPYTLWVSFALILNATLYRLNA